MTDHDLTELARAIDGSIPLMTAILGALLGFIVGFLVGGING